MNQTNGPTWQNHLSSLMSCNDGRHPGAHFCLKLFSWNNQLGGYQEFITARLSFPMLTGTQCPPRLKQILVPLVLSQPAVLLYLVGNWRWHSKHGWQGTERCWSNTADENRCILLTIEVSTSSYSKWTAQRCYLGFDQINTENEAVIFCTSKDQEGVACFRYS